MDEIESLVRGARPASGHRDRAMSERAERELDALTSPAHSGRSESRRGSHGSARPHRGPRRQTIRTRMILATSVIALAAAVGIGLMLDNTPQDSRIAAPLVVTNPSTVLSDAAEKLGESASQGESSRVVPETVDPQALIAWLTSGTATRADQATWLTEMAENDVATSARRGEDDTWRVEVASITLVIRADTGEITAIIDAQGVEHLVPPPM